MKTIHVLSIGNSFSEDAQFYLHDLARTQGIHIEAVNLYVPGCSLYRHFQNMISEKREYILEVNGHKADGFFVSMKEALLAREWDVVTLQQASHLSFQRESYYPYIIRLASYVREMCPNAKLMLHQTWAYESGSKRITDHGFKTYDEMFTKVKTCYDEAAQIICADGIIPSGEAFQYALHNGINRIHRDTFHASLGVGRLLLSLVWFKYLTGCEAIKTDFDGLIEDTPEDEFQCALEAAARS